MPNRKQYLVTCDSTGNETVKLIVGPALPDKIGRDDDYAKPALCQPLVNLSSQAVADIELEFVVPDFQAGFAKGVGQRSDDLLFILRCVRDEYVIDLIVGKNNVNLM